ncbi:sensor histidine kinase [Telluria beijingensis]|uniref:sensor histidine kinase n=1 Tax=Telluria beijingensis TaxID=3068633 RepID=UPI002795A0E4|nr:ATP-binding protein [Massilia sp. REN29]
MRTEPDTIGRTALHSPQPDAARVRALHELQLLDTPPEERFDRITRLACRLLGVPISLLALVDTDRQWFKSRVGIELRETARATSFCTHTIEHPGGLVIEDVRRDPRFAANPFVLGEPRVRFYAGIPLAAPDGSRVGALCVIDREVRHFDADQMATLQDLAAIAGDELRARPAGRPAPEGWEKALVAHLPDGILMLNVHGEIVAANPAAERIFGASGAMLAGRPMSELLGEDVLMRRRAGAALEGRTYQAMARRLDGSHFPVEFSYCRMAWAARPKFAVTMRDITQRRDQEERARATDARRRHHFATATHELRTPMSSVLGFSELLLKRDFDPATQRELLEIIHRESARLVDLVNQLLDLSRIEAGGAADLKLAAVALPDLVAHTLAGLEGLGQSHRVRTELAADLPPLAADRQKIQQALTNIVSNSIKYSAPDTPIVIEAWMSQFEGRPMTAIRVRDQGIGMTPQQQAQVFDAFYRVDRASTVPGSGLGMTILKEIVDLHGGRIAIDSALGAGTEVTLYLPPAVPDDGPA